MPNIAEYTAQGEITPSDKGIQAAEVAGRRLGQLGSEIAEGTRSVARDIQTVAAKVEDHMAVMETSELYKTGTELEYNLQKKWEQQSADQDENGNPANTNNRNNPHFGDQFMATEVGPLLDKWGSGAGTERGKLLAATLKAQIRNNIFHHVTAGQAAMDFAHYQDNKLSFLNTLSAQQIDNPTQQGLVNAQALWRQFLTENTAHIPDVEKREEAMASDLAEGNIQLTLARYHGANEAAVRQIGETGDATKSTAYTQTEDDIAKRFGFEYLSPELQQAVIKTHNETVEGGRRLFETKDATQRKAEDDAVEKALLPIETGMFTTNAAGGVTVRASPDMLAAVNQIAGMPGAERHASAIRELLGAMHTATQDAITGKETVTDRSIYQGLSSMIGSTTNPLTTVEVDKARAAGKLSDSDYSFLRSSAVDSKAAAPKVTHAMGELNRWLEQVKPSIDKSSIVSGIDQSGAVKFSQFAWDAEHKVRQAIASGEDPEKAVERLTDPRNPRGFYGFIPQYQTTNKQGLAHVLEATSPDGVQPVPAPPGGVRKNGGGEDHPLPPVLPNETPDAYLKRISK